MVSQLLVTLLGLGVSYIAYVGYRRYDERAMLYFCLGFVLLFGPPALVGGLVVFAGVGNELAATAIRQASKLVGLVLVVVALRTDG